MERRGHRGDLRPLDAEPERRPGAGQGLTVDLSSDAAYTSYFDSLIAWSVHKGYPMAPAAQQQGLPAQLELAMKKRYVNIRFNVDANNNSATKEVAGRPIPPRNPGLPGGPPGVDRRASAVPVAISPDTG